MIRLEKIERFLFCLFLFLIPFQIRVFLNWGGNEWNSVFLYLTDILLIAVFLLAIFRKGFYFKKQDFLLFLFLIIAGISLFFSSNLGIGIFRFIKLLEFALLFLYVRGNLQFLKLDRIFSVLIASGVVQSLLAIGQFFKQSSLGLKFIEAGIFAPGAPGVATFIMENGEKVMRAYGSFPHPNVLAGFLLMAIFALYAKILIRPIRLMGPMGLILIFALFLTFSRTAIVIFLIISLIMFLLRIIQTRYQSTNLTRMTRIIQMQTLRLFGLFIVSCLISTAILFPYLKSRFLEISLEEQAIDLRFFYNKMAFAMIKERPFLGIGIGNFVWHSQNYPAFLRAAEKMLEMEAPRPSSGQLVPSWIYQPVHNLYLLIAVEMGILGLVVFLLFIAKTLIGPIRPINPIGRIGRIGPMVFLFVAFLILGLTDHYFWTLQSGGLMLWTALALLENGYMENGN